MARKRPKPKDDDAVRQYVRSPDVEAFIAESLATPMTQQQREAWERLIVMCDAFQGDVDKAGQAGDAGRDGDAANEKGGKPAWSLMLNVALLDFDSDEQAHSHAINSQRLRWNMSEEDLLRYVVAKKTIKKRGGDRGNQPTGGKVAKPPNGGTSQPTRSKRKQPQACRPGRSREPKWSPITPSKRDTERSSRLCSWAK